MKNITINGDTLANYNDAEFEREVTEHLNEETRPNRSGHRHITRPELRHRRPGRPCRTFDVLKWRELEQLLKQGTPKGKAATICGLTRRQVRHYIKQFVTRVTGCKPSYPRLAPSNA